MQHLYALEGLISFGLLAAVVFGPWQWVCTDAARQSLFYTRDQLFDIARSGRLEFSSEEYRDIREVFDHQIRFAHALSFVRLLVFARVVRQFAPKPNPARQAIERISDSSTRAEVTELVDKLEQTVSLMMVAKSPILILMIIAAALVIIPTQATRKIFQRKHIWSIRLADVARFSGGLGKAMLALPPAWLTSLIYEEASVFKS